MSTAPSSAGGLPPKSPEAQAAIERVRAANAKSVSSGKGTPSPVPPEATSEEVERVRAIRSALARGHATHKQIADRFGVSRDLVSRIKSGKSYAGVGLDVAPGYPTDHETSDEDQHPKNSTSE